MTNMQIYKMIRTVGSNTDGEWIVTNQDKSSRLLVEEVDVTEAMKSAMGTRQIVYVYGAIENGAFKCGRPVREDEEIQPDW